MLILLLPTSRHLSRLTRPKEPRPPTSHRPKPYRERNLLVHRRVHGLTRLRRNLREKEGIIVDVHGLTRLRQRDNLRVCEGIEADVHVRGVARRRR